MKKLCLLMTLLLIFALLATGCGRVPGILYIDGQEVAVNELLKIDDTPYLLADYLYYFVQLKYQYDGNDHKTWARHPELLEELKENTIYTMQYLQATRELAKENGLKLNRSDKKSIKESLQAARSNYESESAFQSALHYAFMDTHILTVTLEDDIYNNKLMDHFYGKNGTELLSDEEITDAIMNEYVHYKSIYMRLDVDDSTDFKGTMESIHQQLTDGADFQKLMEQYSRDGTFADYPDGYYSAKDSEVDFMEMLIAMKDDTISEVFESENGYYIFWKLPNDREYIAKNVSDFSSSYYSRLLNKKIKARVDQQKVEILSDYYDKINMETVYGE